MILTILFQPITHGLITLLSELLNDHSFQNYKYSYNSFIYFMTTSAIITPLIEEIWFRGLLFQKTKHLGSYKSIFFNGIVFGFIHLNIIEFSYTLLFGMLCCYVFYINKSLIAPIFLHVINNILQNIPENNYTDIYYKFISNPINIIPFIILSFLFIYYFSKRVKEKCLFQQL
ncbi:CPBP family intramembrane glutamic endopeptidase [Bacillus sp. AFS077874]|uniref:CPBP family intramembrane glutamic endopeptidase n=2 Tax=unclassified Bacillus (in: firmicutes) TaxID=185979 RepID=UPI00336BB349